MDLEKLTDERLKAQIKLMQEVLEKREKEKWQEIKPPQKLASIDWDIKIVKSFVCYCENYITEIWETGYANEDYPDWIQEAAIEMVFGEGIWDKIRERQK